MSKAKELQDFMRGMRDGRKERLTKIVQILRENGMPIEESRVLEIAGDATVGRPHVARALVEKGYVASVQEAFDLWLGNGKPADVNRERLDPGGLDRPRAPRTAAWSSSPTRSSWATTTRRPFASSPAGAPTASRPTTSTTSRKRCAITRRSRAKLGLARSGGSDYHGLGNPDDREIGDIDFPDEQVRRVRTFLETHCADTGKKAR